jgi:hypothetical protein
MALFMCRFACSCPSLQSSSADYVTRHLATYANISTVWNVKDVNRRIIYSTIVYPSEPVLAEASAYFTSTLNLSHQKVSRRNVLEVIRLNLLNENHIIKLSEVDASELVACAAIGYTLDAIRESIIREYNANDDDQNMSSDVSVSELLCSLIPEVASTDEIVLFNDYFFFFEIFIKEASFFHLYKALNLDDLVEVKVDDSKQQLEHVVVANYHNKYEIDFCEILRVTICYLIKF